MFDKGADGIWNDMNEPANFSTRKYIDMRYELMPYLYNAFQRAHESGNHIMQPLVYQFQGDEKTHDIQDQFMFGDSMIPTREVQQYTGEKPLTNLILDTYLDNKDSYSYYQDDGSTENYKKGQFNVTDFNIEKKGNHIEFEQLR